MVWYKNLDRSFCFVTIHAFDRRTDIILIAIDRVCIPCSAVKIDRTVDKHIVLEGILLTRKCGKCE